MRRGFDVPMLVVFIGAIGGFLFNGIVGLFIGAIILSLGYKLFELWLHENTTPEEAPEASPASPDSVQD